MCRGGQSSEFACLEPGCAVCRLKHQQCRAHLRACAWPHCARLRSATLMHCGGVPWPCAPWGRALVRCGSVPWPCALQGRALVQCGGVPWPWCNTGACLGAMRGRALALCAAGACLGAMRGRALALVQWRVGVPWLCVSLSRSLLPGMCPCSVELQTPSLRHTWPVLPNRRLPCWSRPCPCLFVRV